MKNRLKNDQEEMNKISDTLFPILFAQYVSSIRDTDNEKLEVRYQALIHDVASVMAGTEPTESQDVLDEHFGNLDYE